MKLPVDEVIVPAKAAVKSLEDPSRLTPVCLKIISPLVAAFIVFNSARV